MRPGLFALKTILVSETDSNNTNLSWWLWNILSQSFFPAWWPSVARVWKRNTPALENVPVKSIHSGGIRHAHNCRTHRSSNNGSHMPRKKEKSSFTHKTGKLEISDPRTTHMSYSFIHLRQKWPLQEWLSEQWPWPFVIQNMLTCCIQRLFNPSSVNKAASTEAITGLSYQEIKRD